MVHLKSAIVALAKEYQPIGVAFVAISSNDAKMYPQDGPLKMAEEARSNCYTFPYLYDESQDVARMYNAVCTPEFMVCVSVDCQIDMRCCVCVAPEHTTSRIIIQG